MWILLQNIILFILVLRLLAVVVVFFLSLSLLSLLSLLLFSVGPRSLFARAAFSTIYVGGTFEDTLFKQKILMVLV